MEAQPPHQVTDLSSSDFQIETISDGLLKPWGIAELPNGSFLVTEFSGALKHIKNGEVRDISGLPDDIFVNGQGGLMGIVLAPDFASSRELFMSYAYGTKDANGTAIFRARLKGAALTGGETIFRAGTKAAGSHFGGRMAFLPDDSLILTLGDGFAYREEAQNLGSHLGKILRLSRDGTPLADNPFSDNSEAKAEIYSYGHRNVQGLIYDAKSGNLWSHEHGPRGGDELNLLKPGANYGWPLATTGRDYNGARITPHDTYEGTEPFIHDWVPSIAPSGLAIYRGDKFPQWEGDALVGALAGQSLWVIDLDGTKSVGETRLLSNLKKRVRDVIVDQDGTILILTESEDGGQLLRISPKP
ncbi:MAG: PQQ-dependent sugar dehydrogenase [Hellea sp.]|nr:PQQ-dependent sugar dehydrogenase [Hellea sp.]